MGSMKMLSVSASETTEYLKEEDIHVRRLWAASEWEAIFLDKKPRSDYSHEWKTMR